MAEKMDMDLQPGYLGVSMEGAFHLGRLKGFFGQIVGAAQKHGRERIYVDMTKVEGKIPIVDRFLIGQHLSDLRPEGIRLALVVDKAQVEAGRFLEKVATNRGVLLMVTADPEDAWQWLGVHPKVLL
jgi:hypothetical protein